MLVLLLESIELAQVFRVGSRNFRDKLFEIFKYSIAVFKDKFQNFSNLPKLHNNLNQNTNKTTNLPIIIIIIIILHHILYNLNSYLLNLLPILKKFIIPPSQNNQLPQNILIAVNIQVFVLFIRMIYTNVFFEAI